MKHRALAFIVVLLCLAAQNCVFAESESPAEVIRKANARHDAAYANLLLKIGLSRSPGMNKLTLEKAQAAWIKYRDDQINFVITFHNPIIADASPLGIAKYYAILTEARAQELEKVPNPF